MKKDQNLYKLRKMKKDQNLDKLRKKSKFFTFLFGLNLDEFGQNRCHCYQLYVNYSKSSQSSKK